MPKLHTAPAESAESLQTAASRKKGRSFRRLCNYYRDVFGGWRWEFEDAEGDMRDSHHSYETYAECVAAARCAGLQGIAPGGHDRRNFGTEKES